MNFFKSEYNDELNKQESLKRITSPHFAYTDLDVEVYVDDLVMSANDPRADGIDPNHVDSLYYKISVDGVDDDSRAIVMETEYDSNKYYSNLRYNIHTKACCGMKHAVEQSMLWNKACFSVAGPVDLAATSASPRQ